MKRTSLLLPPDLRNRADRQARAQGISFAEFVRRALAAALAAAEAKEKDPLFLDTAVHEGEVPYDASDRHDDHLYGGDG